MEPVVHVDAVDAQWLTAALSSTGALTGDAQVIGVRRETCGTGQLADSYRFTLEYDMAGAGPATVVGKFPFRRRDQPQVRPAVGLLQAGGPLLRGDRTRAYRLRGDPDPTGVRLPGRQRD